MTYGRHAASPAGRGRARTAAARALPAGSPPACPPPTGHQGEGLPRRKPHCLRFLRPNSWQGSSIAAQVSSGRPCSFSQTHRAQDARCLWLVLQARPGALPPAFAQSSGQVHACCDHSTVCQKTVACGEPAPTQEWSTCTCARDTVHCAGRSRSRTAGRRRSGGSSSGGHTGGRGPAGVPRRRPSYSHSGRRVTVPSRPEYRKCPLSYREAYGGAQKP